MPDSTTAISSSVSPFVNRNGTHNRHDYTQSGHDANGHVHHRLSRLIIRRQTKPGCYRSRSSGRDYPGCIRGLPSVEAGFKPASTRFDVFAETTLPDRRGQHAAGGIHFPGGYGFEILYDGG